jgi:UDP-N-acetylmuramyl pentapeptide synthase
VTTFTARAIEDALSRSGELRSSGTMPDSFTDITDDSRRVTTGALFVAMRGTAFDGHDYLGAAAASGATAAIVEDPSRTSFPPSSYMTPATPRAWRRARRSAIPPPA